ncbi:hypothetical protein JHK86_018045 [Glycine max]|nr:hypothetical protein JHK86_018045 [Glycine max]
MALGTLAFQNDDNKNQIVECKALPTLVLMLRSEDITIHCVAVDVIRKLVNSSPNNKKEVLLARDLQPVLCLLSSRCSEIQTMAAFLLCQFATDSDCKVHVSQRGAIPLLVDLLKSPNALLQEVSTFALWRLAKDATVAGSPSAPPEATEKAVLRILAAILNLIDKDYSVELACDDFSVICL